MLNMDQYEMIRTAHRVYGKSIRELAKEFGHHRKTIKKVIKGIEPSYNRIKDPPNPVMDKYKEIVIKWLKDDKESPKKQKHTARRIYKRLVQEYGFNGGESTVRRFVKICKGNLDFILGESSIPLDCEVAKEAEVDWGDAIVIMDGTRLQVKIFTMRSRFSGKIFAQSFPNERQAMFFEGHIRAFQYFGGIFKDVVYDNLKTAVKKVLCGRGREEQYRFIALRAYYTFKSIFCNTNSGNEKGGVEGAVGYVRRNFLTPIPSFRNFAELNRFLLEECMKDGFRPIEGRKDTRTINELHNEEKRRFLSLPSHPYENVNITEVKIDKYQTARFDRNRYSVPTQYVNRRLKVHIRCFSIQIYDGNKRIASHKRVFGRNNWELDPQHYLKMIHRKIMSFNSARPIVSWRKSWPQYYERFLDKLVKRHGEDKGKREFVNILQLHGDHKTEDVEDAVKQALSYGAVGYESVKQILRMKFEPVQVVECIPHKRIPGITDIPLWTVDLQKYDYLLNGGIS